MLHDDGSFAFRTEILDAVDAVVQAYEAHVGDAPEGLERELLIAFVMGRMRCEMDLITDAMAASPTLEGVDPQDLYEECVSENSEARRQQVEQMTALLRERGWIAEVAPEEMA
jgi:hypothetical protein